MALNNVTKFHKILIKTIRLRERTSFKTVKFHKQRAIYLLKAWTIIELEEDTTVLNNVAKFHKILIKSIQFREPTSLEQTCVCMYVCKVPMDKQG